LAQRQIQIDLFEVVLPHSPKANASGLRIRHPAQRNPQKPGVNPAGARDFPTKIFVALAELNVHITGTTVKKT
jgi:hypothetical protein